MIKLLFFFSVYLVFANEFEFVRGLRCYTCSYDEKDSREDYRCVVEPWNLTGNPIRTCISHVKYCIIVRIEAKETEKVTSFLRKCEESPVEDSDVDSPTVIAHYRSCSTDLCNSGDGLNFVDGGHDGDSVAILVPDKSSRSSEVLALSLSTSFLCHLVIFFY